MSRLLKAGVKTERQYLTGIDLLIGHPGTPTVLVYPQGLDEEELAHSLQIVLKTYPLFTGRVKRDEQGQIYLDGCDEGVSFMVAHHPQPLPAYGVLAPIGADMGRFYKQIYPWAVVDQPQSPMMIEVHQFTCGGAILSFTGLHSVCDGNGFWAMMIDWMRVHHGHPISTPPMMDRRPLLDLCQQQAHTPYTQGLIRQISRTHRARLTARFAWQTITELRRIVFRVSREQLAEWREQIRAEEGEGQHLSSHELVVAHCMKTLSRHMPRGMPRHLGTITDLRFRRLPGISRKYVGNMLGQDLIELSEQALAEGSLSGVARQCQIPLDHISEADVLSYLGLVERHREAGTTHQLFIEGAIRCLDAGVILNNCAHFPVYKLDFGKGGPSWFEVNRSPYRKMMIAPTPMMDGGLDVHLVARRAEVAAFKTPLC